MRLNQKAMIPDSKFYEIMSKATMGMFDEHELGITGIESGAKQFARHIAIDFFNWQKKTMPNAPQI